MLKKLIVLLSILAFSKVAFATGATDADVNKKLEHEVTKEKKLEHHKNKGKHKKHKHEKHEGAKHMHEEQEHDHEAK